MWRNQLDLDTQPPTEQLAAQARRFALDHVSERFEWTFCDVGGNALTAEFPTLWNKRVPKIGCSACVQRRSECR